MATTIDALPAEADRERDPMRPLPCRVLRTQRETRNIFTVALSPPFGMDRFAFRPGQFNMLYSPGVGEVPVSISGRPEGGREIVHTIREVGPVTRALGTLRRGDTVALRGPFGTAWPVAGVDGSDMVFVAGGIGLAPLRPALYHVLSHRERFGRITLLFGTRTPADLLFRREIEAWRGRLDVDVEVTVDRGDPEWHGPVGVVTRFVPHAAFDAARTHAFVCGPELMMMFAVRELLRRGVAPGQVHVSLERNMKCAIGLCGHCQMGPLFVCRDGPVFTWDRVQGLLATREI
jgi:NAD(P)H-flavin reductase